MVARQEKFAVVLLSGGLDSMVAGGIAREQGFDILALTVDYNQRHRVELESAARIADALGAKRHVVLPLDLTQFGGSALTADIDVPKDGAGTRDEGGIPITYVPARNTIFLSLCLGWAEAAGARRVDTAYRAPSWAPCGRQCRNSACKITSRPRQCNHPRIVTDKSLRGGPIEFVLYRRKPVTIRGGGRDFSIFHNNLSTLSYP